MTSLLRKITFLSLFCMAFQLPAMEKRPTYTPPSLKKSAIITLFQKPHNWQEIEKIEGAMDMIKPILVHYIAIQGTLPAGTPDSQMISVQTWLDEKDSLGSKAITVHPDGTLDLSYRGINDLTGLANIPNVANVKTIKLIGNRLTKIDANQFAASPMLQELWLRNNAIEKIADTAFAGLPHLQLLDLGKNKIKAIGVNMFAGLNNLLLIDLSENDIDELEIGSLSNLPRLVDVNHKNITNKVAQEALKKLDAQLKSKRSFLPIGM